MSGLIVNADDLGLTDGVDRAVLALHAAGALSSATAMAGARRPGAMPRAGVSPGSLSALMWFLWMAGRPALRSRFLLWRPAVRSARNWGGSASDLLRGKVPEQEMEREARAQIASLQRLASTSPIWTRTNTPTCFRRFFGRCCAAARACGLSAVRNPFEPSWASAATFGAPLLRRIEVRLLATMQARFLHEVLRMDMRTTAGALGVLATGTLDEETLRRLLGALARHGRPEECYELVCHPAFHDAELDRQSTRLRAQREVERAALLKVIPDGIGPGSGQHRLMSFAHL